jgi:hypothetical protein
VYDQWTPKEQLQNTAGLLNKLSLLDAPAITETFAGNTLNSAEAGKITILDLSGVTDSEARIIGGLLLATVIHQDPDTTVIVNDCHFFLREFRKTKHLRLILANDYETQLPQALLDAVLGYCTTVISFCLGADVKRIGARLDLSEPNALRRLDDGQALVATRINRSPAYRSIRTFALPRALGRLPAIRRWTKSVYGR